MGSIVGEARLEPRSRDERQKARSQSPNSMKRRLDCRYDRIRRLGAVVCGQFFVVPRMSMNRKLVDGDQPRSRELRGRGFRTENRIGRQIIP